jgi:hypothetical protein
LAFPWERDPDVAPPIHVSTTFDADDADGLSSARAEQPTRRRLEAVLGALEGGEAVVYASGQAAATAALLHLRPRRVAPRGAAITARAAVDALAPLTPGTTSPSARCAGRGRSSPSSWRARKPPATCRARCRSSTTRRRWAA